MYVKKTYIRTIFCCALLLVQDLSSISLVYNMKIRRAFSPHVFAQLPDRRKIFWLVTALPIVYGRKRHIVAPELQQNIHEKGFVVGSLFNVRWLLPRYWWAELTTGLEHQKNHFTGTEHFTVSRTGCDDIVLSAGKNIFFHHDKGQFVVYGIAGFPTKAKVTMQEATDTLVGTRFFGLGAGSEISYSFLKNPKHAFTGILQARCVHFFNRKWFPILPCGDSIQPGNLTDVFLLGQYRYKKNVFEVGYNPTFFTHQAALLRAGKQDAPNVIRNSFYASFIHVFKKMFFLNKPGGIGTGFNIGRAKTFDTKIFSWWVNLSVLF